MSSENIRHVAVPRETHEAIKRLAEKEERAMTVVVARAIREYAARRDEVEP